jgi:hypothetical protein
MYQNREMVDCVEESQDAVPYDTEVRIDGLNYNNCVAPIHTDIETSRNSIRERECKGTRRTTENKVTKEYK